MNNLGSPPVSLLDAQGAPQEGAYAGLIADAVLPCGFFRGLRQKIWRYAGVFQDDWAIGVAIADVGYLGVTFAYIARGRELREQTWKSPAAAGMRVGPPDGASVAVAPGRTVALSATREGGVTASFVLPGIRAELDIAGSGTPLTVVSDVGRGRRNPGLTIKRAGLPARGTIWFDGQCYTLNEAHACLDFTQAFFPRRTDWQWATAGGRDVQGRRIGFNLALGVHDDARGRFNENALWVDGVPAALPAVAFTPALGSAPWSVRSADGAVELSFTPRGERKEDVNLLALSSRYRQPFGTFTGQLRDASGRTVALREVPGVTEDHHAVW